ncbi:Uncharacterized protein TPAR_04833 [Tolypocladium paradoxum]|uniref:DUF7730 domain-containing protein n=1 Tax=Tolypocladium paradoxum TaxID=94208 RepID=A0A2S4KXN7_9HYPO|nr:Uncharacterized protein TPAR_04833 [Tolypocladium paradoxum]
MALASPFVGDSIGDAPRLGTILKSPLTASKWIRKKLDPRKNNPTLPTLPAKRPRPITPSPSCENLNHMPHPQAAIAESAFFQRLPFEVRRRVLVEAFGEQTVHMDLIYDYPLRPPKPRRASRDAMSHCNMNLYRYGGLDDSRVKVKDSRPKRYMWRSSVCHRNMPVPGAPGHRVQPSQDLCRFGIVDDAACDLWPGEYPSKCFIGAMGWLLTCRQAYVEGIDVLYATNTIHSASKELLYNIDRFLLPQRRSSINSVELMWEFDAPRLQDRDRNIPFFKEFLEVVPSMFPRVEFLHLAVQWRTPCPPHGGVPEPSEWEYETMEDIVMRPVDKMVRRLGPRVRECSVAIPSTMYAPRRRRAKEAGEVVEHACYGGQLERYWRPLGGDSEHHQGYWVRHGLKDVAFPYMSPLDEDVMGILGMEDWILFHGL